MEKKDVLTRILAIVGTLLVLIPILAPVLFSVVRMISDGIFRFDYLMPAELFPLALIGGVLLLWAAVRSRLRRKIIGWALGIAVGVLFAGQALTLATGMASGETEPEGWWWIIVLSSLAIYTLALVALAVGGILLLRDLLLTRKQSA